MIRHESKFLDRTRRVAVPTEMLLAVVITFMWGVIVWLLWEIHTIVSIGFGL